jgi:hypothetical protein
MDIPGIVSLKVVKSHNGGGFGQSTREKGGEARVSSRARQAMRLPRGERERAVMTRFPFASHN